MKRSPLKGSSTLELLIAFAILTLSLTAMVSVMFGNQSVAVDTETANAGLSEAGALLETARADAREDYLGLITSMPETFAVGPLTYTKTLTVADLTPCKKQATSTVTWSLGPLRPQKIELTTLITDVVGALQLGGDCFANPPSGGWTNPTRFASDTLSPGKPTAIDVLDGIVYIGLDKAPWLAIADTRNAVLGQNSGLFVSFPSLPLLTAQINSLDVIRWTDPSTGAKKRYLFAAIDTATNQFMVIDVTTMTAPQVVAILSPCATGSFPEGWYVYAYGDRLYFTTRETANKELHIYNIANPSVPVELPIGTAGCYGYELGSTIEQFVVRDQKVAGVDKRYMFMATDQNSKEIRILDVTNSSSISEASNVDLAGNQDGASIYLVGTNLYFGRMTSPTGPELYVYNIANPSSPQLLGSREIDASVLGIRVASQFGFLATSKTNKEFQVWNVSNPSTITNIATYNFGNIASQGIDYEPDFIYATGQATPNLQILYSP